MRYLAIPLALSIALLLGAVASEAAGPDSPIGVPPVDATIAALKAHDLPTIVAAAEFIDRPCVKTVSPDAPLCPQDSDEGSIVGSVVFASCGLRAFWGPGEAGIGYLFPQLLEGAASSSVFAVLRGSLTPEPAQDYIVALTPGDLASPTDDGSLWQIQADGSIVAIADQCAPVGIVQSIERYFPEPVYETEPLYNCTPPPGERVRVTVIVEGGYGDVKPHFWGHGQTAAGEPLPERFVIDVRNTSWSGDVTYFHEVRIGMQVEVEGVRLPNCIIGATSATVTRAAPPAAPGDVRINFLTREITWIDNATTEEGFRITYQIAQGPTGSATVPPNTTRFVVPGTEPLGGCGYTTIKIVAFNSAGDSSDASYGVIADCFLLEPPNTGTGSASGVIGGSAWPTLAALVLALLSAVMFVLGHSARAR